jgi:hypothetical protein
MAFSSSRSVSGEDGARPLTVAKRGETEPRAPYKVWEPVT